MPGILLARVNFPPYVVKILSERHILVAGGGGEAKTGIANSIEIYELIKNKKKNTCRAERVCHFDTGSMAIMNATVFDKGKNLILFTGGLNGICVIYQIKIVVENNLKFINEEEIIFPDNGNNKINGLVKRKKNDTINLNNNQSRNICNNLAQNNFFKLSFEINVVTNFQADFNVNNVESYLKVLKYSSTAKLLITGGSDGFIRFFNYPSLKINYFFNAHTDEITGLDIDSSGFKLISISRDLHSYIWDIKAKKKVIELNHGQNKLIDNQEIKYNFRGCVFGTVENNLNEVSLFTLHNPYNKTKLFNKSFICKWNTKTYKPSKIIYAGSDNFSTIAISEDGRFIGVGMFSGAVEIYIAFSLQRVYLMPNAHKLFVSNVEFLKCSKEAQILSGNHDVSLISISIDNHIVIHHIPKKITLGFFNSSLIFIVVMFFIYILLDYLGL